MSDASRPRVLLVDDSLAVQRQVRAILAPRFDVVDALEGGERLATAVATHRPDVIVLDVSLPGESGFTLASRLVRSECGSKIVFLTVHADRDYARAALGLGASGYVVKTRLAVDLLPALDSVLAGGFFVSPCSETH